VEAVPSDGEIEIKKNGYIYVFVSNESRQNVYFDEIRVEHIRGPLTEETHYYPFGLAMAGISSKSAGSITNKYKFGGKELQLNEFSDNSGLDLYDFNARNYDPQVGRWWSGDSKADKLVSWSPYNYCFNNPIKFFDSDGEYPWPVHVRSFISTPTTGGGLFRGDGRGPSTTSSPDATSRVRSTFTVDPAKGTVTKPDAKSDLTVFYGVPPNIPPKVEEGSPKASITNQNTSEGTVSFDFSHSGKDPITPEFVTPALDVHASLSFTENLKNGTLTINGSITGDKFPSTEAFITDQSGKTQLFLGAKKEDGGVSDLFGDNKKDLFSVNMVVTFDAKGNFTGVKQGDKTYTVEEWNKKVQDEFGKK
jgi:RHS repeat-associated protein